MADNILPTAPDTAFKEDLALLMQKHAIIGMSVMVLKAPPAEAPNVALIGIMVLHNQTPMAADLTDMFCGAMVGVKDMLSSASAATKPSIIVN